MKKKVCVVPCSGMGKALGSVAREVGFILAEDLRPDKTFLVCIPSLAAGVEEHSKMIRTNSVIVIDGCAERCATKIAAKAGAKIKGRFFLPQSIRKHCLKPKNRDDIGLEGENLAKKIAEDVAANIDKLSE
jgi:uncharacterized metal-binding protein